ncbi:hypothetical protein B0T13DRAFT_1290 [Neurospora crassa]|nr:hypothetical protein B0T13DRAFT_1290 [Neurospora crassa]
MEGWWVVRQAAQFQPLLVFGGRMDRRFKGIVRPQTQRVRLFQSHVAVFVCLLLSTAGPPLCDHQHAFRGIYYIQHTPLSASYPRTTTMTIYQSLYLPGLLNLGHQPQPMRWLVDHRRIFYNCDGREERIVSGSPQLTTGQLETLSPTATGENKSHFLKQLHHAAATQAQMVTRAPATSCRDNRRCSRQKKLPIEEEKLTCSCYRSKVLGNLGHLHISRHSKRVGTIKTLTNTCIAAELLSSLFFLTTVHGGL